MYLHSPTHILRDAIVYVIKHFNLSSSQQPKSSPLKHNPRVSHTVIPPNRKDWTYNKVHEYIHTSNQQSKSTDGLV